MAEVLTYDSSPAETEVLTQEEQDNAQVGKELREQHETLLAGKYKNAEDLEKAYVELEKKLGSSDDKPEAEEDSQEPPESKKEEEEKEADFLDQLWEESQNEKYSEDILKKLGGMDASEIADMHLKYRAEVAKQGSNERRDLSEQDVEQLQSVVGGKENFQSMLKWAQQNLQENEIEMFDTVMDRGDPLSAFFAVRSLAYRYQEASGYDGKMLTGSAAKESGDNFRSQQEVVAAMSDPRYETDPAYRQDVMKKLERSKISFRN